MNNDLFGRLGLTYPIIQAPMAGVATPAMAAAVCNAGGLGSLGLADLTPADAQSQIEALRKATNRAFHINFFVHAEPDLKTYDATAMRARLTPYYEELGLGAVPEPSAPYPSFNDAMLRVVLATRPAVVSFHFGLPDAAMVRAIREAGIMVMGSATSIAEARALQAGGAEAVIAQGWEAGGHRGVFLGPLDAQSAGTMALVPQVVDAVKVPVIAAGGIFDGRGIKAALKLGAMAAQLGTAFLLCPEANTNALYRRAITDAAADSTRVTRIFSGRPARVIANRFVRENVAFENAAAPFPAQHSLTRPLRKPSEKSDVTGFLPLYAGQAVAATRALPAAELMAKLIGELAAP